MFVQFFVQYPVTVRMYACTCVRAASVDNESDNRILPSRVIFADVSWENERNLFSDALKLHLVGFAAMGWERAGAILRPAHRRRCLKKLNE